MRNRILGFGVVMILLVVSGAVAYSSFTGTATTRVSATAEFSDLSENVSVCAFWANNTELYVNNHGFVGNSSYLFNDLDPGISVASTTSFTNTLVDTLNISNLAPGNAILFCMNITNPNSYGYTLSNISIGPFGGSGLEFINETFCNNEGAWFGVVNQTMANTSTPGGYYGIVEESSSYIAPGQSLSVGFFMYLSQCSTNAYQESSFSFPITVNLYQS